MSLRGPLHILISLSSRVDLHPVSSHDSTASQNPEALAPPLGSEAESSNRRRIAFREILSLRHRPTASAEERISALRRLREQRRNQSGDIDETSAEANADEAPSGARDRRSKRMSARLSDVFSGRSRRERSDEMSISQGESSRTGGQPSSSISSSSSPSPPSH